MFHLDQPKWPIEPNIRRYQYLADNDTPYHLGRPVTFGPAGLLSPLIDPKILCLLRPPDQISPSTNTSTSLPPTSTLSDQYFPHGRFVEARHDHEVPEEVRWKKVKKRCRDDLAPIDVLEKPMRERE